MHPCDNGAVIGIHEEDARPHHVAKRRAGLAKRFVDDLKTTSSLYTDIGVDVAVRPDRGSGGYEDEALIAHSSAEADGRLQRRARADALPHTRQTIPRIRSRCGCSECRAHRILSRLLPLLRGTADGTVR